MNEVDENVKDISDAFKTMMLTNAEIMDNVELGSYEGKDIDSIYKRQAEDLKSKGALLWLDIPESNAFVHITQLFDGYGRYGIAYLDHFLNSDEEGLDKLKLMVVSLIDYVSDNVMADLPDLKDKEPEILQK